MNPFSFLVPCRPHRGRVASQSPEPLVVYRHTHLLPMWSAKLRPRQATGWNNSAEPAELRDLKEWLKVPVKLFKLAQPRGIKGKAVYLATTFYKLCSHT